MTNSSVPQTVYNLIILDESGSMDSIYNAALSGVNEVLQGIGLSATGNPEWQQQLQLVSFNSLGIKQRIAMQPWQKDMALRPNQYRPAASTPLYDAMGSSLTALESQLDKETPQSVIATIITDGQENASTEYDARAINALITRLRARGWQIIFVGANVDVEAITLELNIRHKMRFSSSADSTGKLFNKLTEHHAAMMKPFAEGSSKRVPPTEWDKDIDAIDEDLRDENDKPYK